MQTQAQLGGKEAGRQLMPVGVRRALLAVLGLVLAGALYLVAVRGIAILLDLSSGIAGLLCL